MFRAIAITTLLLLCAAVPASAAAPGVSPLPGTGEPGPISCWAPGDCILTTAYQSNTYTVGILRFAGGKLVSRQLIKRGTDGAPEDIEGLSCPTQSVCYATGLRGPESTLGSAATGGFIAQIVNGRWGKVLTFPKIEDVNNIACSADGDCLATGMNSGTTAASARSYLFALDDGRVTSTQSLGDIYPGAISCGDARLSDCLVVGVNNHGGGGATVHVVHGRPAPVRTLTWDPALVSCAGGGHCLIAGYSAPNSSPAHEYLNVVTGGAPGRTRTVPYALGGIVCVSATHCVGTADFQKGAGTVSIDNGVAATPQLISGVFDLDYVAAAGGSYLADGTAAPGTKGIAITF